MKYTLGTAAKACGVARTTILRAIKSGKISAAKDEVGSYAIDPAELHRVFPPVAVKQSAEHAVERYATGDGTAETAVLLAKIGGLEVLLNRERETVDDLRRRLDEEAAERRKASEEIRRLTLMITDQRRQPEPTHATEPPNKGGLFEKLFGKKNSGG